MNPLDFAAKVDLRGPPLPGPAAISTIWFVLTYQCNNRCIWCYSASNRGQAARSEMWPAKHEDAAIGLMAALGPQKIVLIGGEPTLYPQLPRLIKKMAQAGLRPGMVTNGRLLSNKKFARELAESGLASATFSIEGSCAAAHDAVTQIRGSLAQAMQGLQNARDAGIAVSTNTIISSITCKDLDKIVDMLYSNGVTRMSYNICGICMHEQTNNTCLIDPRSAIKAFERVYAYATARGAQVKLVTPMPLCDFNARGIAELVRREVVAKGPCQLSHGRGFVLDYNGDVLPCTHLTGYPLFNIFESGGVLSKREFLRKYRSKPAVRFRSMFSKFASRKCAGCQMHCSGGCPIYWTHFDPDEQIMGSSTLRPE